MAEYDAPVVIDHRKLSGQLGDLNSVKPISDAGVKHGVERVGNAGYEAPLVTDRRELGGELAGLNSNLPG